MAIPPIRAGSAKKVPKRVLATRLATAPNCARTVRSQSSRSILLQYQAAIQVQVTALIEHQRRDGQ
jgi:hypothetical protein